MQLSLQKQAQNQKRLGIQTPTRCADSQSVQVFQVGLRVAMQIMKQARLEGKTESKHVRQPFARFFAELGRIKSVSAYLETRNQEIHTTAKCMGKRN